MNYFDDNDIYITIDFLTNDGKSVRFIVENPDVPP
jgi:hypothetical protein